MSGKKKILTLLLITESAEYTTSLNTFQEFFLFLAKYSFILNDNTSKNIFLKREFSNHGELFFKNSNVARYLDPKYSRWISTDPALGEYMSGSDAGCGGAYNPVNMNLYHYAGNNPIKYTDPDGRELCIDGEDWYQNGVMYWLKELTNDEVYIDENGKVTVSARTGISGFFYNLFHKSKPTGTELLRELCKDDNKKCTISQYATDAKKWYPG